MIQPDFYKDLAASALDATRHAIQAIEYQLPVSVVAQLKQKKKHANDPYDDIKHAYLGCEDADPIVVALLVDLVQLAHAAAQLGSVVTTPKETACIGSLNLQLAKQRRLQ